MATILSNNLLVNGLRTEFVDTYTAIRNRQSDGRLSRVMDLSIQATNREHDAAYLNAAPHADLWLRGNSIPTDAMGAVQFKIVIYEWARRIAWSKWDRKDDQTQSLMDAARATGESHGLLPERFFFDLLVAGGGGTATTLPNVRNAPDGAAFFNTTDGDSANRFGVANGNKLTGSGITTTEMIQSDYYAAIEQFMLFQDGKGQPLLSPETIAGGTIIVHAAADTEAFEIAFKQLRQGIGLSTTGARSSTATITAATAESNIILDSSRNVDLWGSPRLATGDWYIFLQNPPKQSCFFVEREAPQEFSSLEGDNNSDHTRDTAEEYIQWESRSGAGVALPYGAIMIDNS